MATYKELPAEDRATLDNWLNNFRAASGEVQRLNRVLEELGAYAQPDGAVGKILAKLASNAVLPNSSGLAGAASVELADVVEILQHFAKLRENASDEMRQRYRTMAGPLVS